MKAIHFGAGNIGRGFIGLLLSQAGYELTFVDVSDVLVGAIQAKGSYTVELADGSGRMIEVHNVNAIDGKNSALVAEAIAGADLVTTAVGVHILKHIAGTIAQGIEKRLTASVTAPLHVIACENAIGGSTQLKELVYGHLPAELHAVADRSIAFPDAAVDRIVPLQHHEDPLHVTVEPFYEWVVDRSATLPGFQEIEGVHYVEGLEPFIERKLFTVNTGHCVAAYHGYLRGCSTIQEAMAQEAIRAEVRAALQETGAVLIHKYDFDSAQHDQYIEKILGRFTNPYLSDEVERVGRSPIRKLSPSDRLVRPAMLAAEYGLKTEHLVQGMAAALHFDYADDPEAVEIQSSLKESGLSSTITRYTGLAADHPLHQALEAAYNQVKQQA
ncbi:mannitol-1-phosphate 5-dehydrogenase [Paenibacillus phyllosphaerae]|uniref:Mannitol-1-phosphate 5-dehydrogenase n=1 Tax=Paenibacillus phyllosphaerae TaxID=274593 RepID=A0A7W5FLH1_9BACL|nr:mannitol-1-phosphate 5-dehydrogenase [Paenibacillus phyllosphaerae]MBB3108987.1 mannitol-1-phosphate 5-dehydrogenase [Paenibacillus phyllosphaerae]